MTRTVNISLPEPEYRALQLLTNERRDRNRSAVIRELIDNHMPNWEGGDWGESEWYDSIMRDADREEVAS
jgi:hypothetical protein